VERDFASRRWNTSTRARPRPGAQPRQINFDDIHYFVRRLGEKTAATGARSPRTSKNTFDRLGIPEAERNSSPRRRQYESESYYTR